MAKPFALPGQPTRYARDKKYEILHTILEVELEFGKKAIAGTVTHTIRTIAPVSSLDFDAAELNILSVKVDGKEASYLAPSQNLLRVPCKVATGQTSEIEIEYSASPRKGLYFRGPIQDFPNRFVHAFTQGQAEDSKYWFPCYDYPNMRGTSEVIVKTSPQMTAVSNGALVSTKVVDGKKVWHYKQDVPHSSYLISLIVGDYERIEEDHSGLLLEYFVPAGKNAEASRSFSKTPKMIDFFSRITGQPYPYPKYAQTVVSDFMFGGMENIAATTLTEKTLHDERSHLDYSSDMLVAHELIHQWFGDYITCRDWSHAWLNEGFASYFAALFREFDEGQEEYQYFLNGYREVLSDEIDERYERPIVTKSYFDPEEMFDSHTYEKGALALNALRGYLGDEVFFSGIKYYVSKCKISLVETFDFRKAMEDSSGLNLEPFFEQWIYGQGYPDYSAKYFWNEESKTAEISIEQVNAGQGGTPLFTTPIAVSFSLETGQISRKITMTSRNAAFYFSLDKEPLNVSIDPENWILKKLAFQKPKEMFIFQLKNDKNAMERIRACWELSKFKTDDVILALSTAVATDKFWGVGLEAAASLGKIGTERALKALLARKNHEHHKVRRGVAIGLRNFALLERNETAIDTLIEYLNNDHSYYVRAYAAHSLGFFQKSEKAFEALMSALVQDSINDQVRYRAFLGLSERKDFKGLEVAIDHLKNGKEVQDKLGAAFAIGRVGRGRVEALDALLSAGEDPDLRVRAAAASAIYKLEDTGAIPKLERWLASESSGRCRRRLRESIYFLKEGLPEKEKLSKLSGDVEKLKSENEELKEKISALENSG
ncbi:MAG: M1 family aminopeptidase [Nitrososphaerales archaeon]